MTRPPSSSLRIALEKVDFPMPARVTDDTSVLTLKNLVFEPLCRWDDGVVRPALFSHWTLSDDGRSWRFHIREGARFHDDRPCTADDVIAFVGHLLEAVDTFGMTWPYARYLAGTRITAASSGCVQVDSTQVIGDLPEVFSEFYPCRVDADGRPILGTGPYRVIDWQVGVSATLRSVDPARYETLHFDACASADERHRRVVDGASDGALNLERMSAQPAPGNLRWQRRGNTLSVMSYLDCTRGLFAVPAARLAINLAIDRQRIVDEVCGGLGIPAATVVSPWHFGFRESAAVPIAHHPDRARRLFDEAHATVAAETIVLRTPLTMPHGAPEITRMIASMLTGIGLDVRIDTETDRPSYARQIGRKEMGDSAIFDSSPHSTFRILDDKISSTVRGTWWQGYSDATLDAMIVTANRTADDRARALAYGACLAHLNRHPPWLYLFHPIEVMAARPDAIGLSLDHKGILAFARRTPHRPAPRS